MKAISTRSGVSYDGPQIPPPLYSLPKEVENEPEVTKDTVRQSTENIQPPVVQTNDRIDEPVAAPKPKSTLPYPSRVNKQKFQEKDDKLALKFVEIFRNLHFELSLADALLFMPKFASIFLIPCDFPELVECLALVDLSASINLMPLSIWEKLSLLPLTPTRMILELADRSITTPSGIAKDVYVKVGKFHFPADFVVVDYVSDPRVPLILGRPFLRTAHALIDVYGEELTLRFNHESVTFKVGDTSGYSYNDYESINRIDGIDMSCEKESDFILEEIEDCLASDSIPPGKIKTIELQNKKSSIDDPPWLELKDLPSYLECAFLEGTDKLPVIIAKNVKEDEKAQLLTVLKSHKRAITWKLSDIKGIDPLFCTHKILMEDDSKPSIQHQRRVNPKIHKVIKKEVIKLLDVGLIYPISDSPWVSPVHCVPKKGGMTVVTNEENGSIPTRLVTRWRVCIDYQKLNDATRKDHFPLPFMDQMSERLVGNEYYCFLDGFSGYFQIPIDLKDQEKTTFACPYGTFAYRRMPFGLCNAPGTF
ncbi:reverse transcriptase domain-containing protein [Tanacetum coccineum]